MQFYRKKINNFYQDFFIGVNSIFPFFFVNYILFIFIVWEEDISALARLFFEELNNEDYFGNSNIFLDTGWRFAIVLYKSIPDTYSFTFLLEARINGGLYLDKVWDVSSNIYKLIPGLLSFNFIKGTFVSDKFVVTLRIVKSILYSLPAYNPTVFLLAVVCLVGVIFGSSIVDAVCIDGTLVNPMDTLENGYSGNGIDPDTSFSLENKQSIREKSPSDNEEVNSFYGTLIFFGVFLFSVLSKG